MNINPLMRFEIRRAKNGWILKAEQPSSEANTVDEVVCQEEYGDDDIECFADFLRVINEEFGPSTSRYSPKRIYVRVEPGDNYNMIPPA